MTRLNVVDLFCGGGGSSRGAQDAGAVIRAGVDAWSVASDTYARNFPQALSLNHRMVGESVLPGLLTLGRIDLLLASPECTNHTCARGSRPVCEDSRLTAWQVVHHAKALRPGWIVIENVVQMRRWDRYAEFLKELEHLGYPMEPHDFDSSHFGVPQTRRRWFLVGSRNGRPLRIEAPGAAPVSSRSILDPAGTWRVTPLLKAGRAESTLRRAETAFKALGRKEPFLLVYYGSDQSGGWQSLDRPLRTMTTLDRFALVEPGPHGHTMRMLQVSELRRAMGFRDSHILDVGTRRDRVKLLGNGVCPPVMRHIVKTIAREGARGAATRGRSTPRVSQ